MADRYIYTRILWTIHSRLQMYIRKCRNTEVGDLEPELLNFDNMRKFILVEGCRANLPEVLMKELKKTEKKRGSDAPPSDGIVDGAPSRTPDKRKKNERGEPVFLMDHLVQDALLLRNGENFGDLTGAIRKFPECVPVTPDGDQICIKIMGTKKCHSKCKYAKWHNKALTSTQIESGKKLLAKMRD